MDRAISMNINELGKIDVFSKPKEKISNLNTSG